MTYHSNMFFKLKNSGIIIGYGGSTGRVTAVDPFPTLYPDLKESTVILSITDFSQEEIDRINEVLKSEIKFTNGTSEQA